MGRKAKPEKPLPANHAIIVTPPELRVSAKLHSCLFVGRHCARLEHPLPKLKIALLPGLQKCASRTSLSASRDGAEYCKSQLFYVPTNQIYSTVQNSSTSTAYHRIALLSYCFGGQMTAADGVPRLLQLAAAILPA